MAVKRLNIMSRKICAISLFHEELNEGFQSIANIAEWFRLAFMKHVAIPHC